MEREEEEEDMVCLDESFFINDNYELTTFTFGSQVIQLLCLQSASRQLVWPGAMLLNDYLSRNAEMLQGCSVIELGSGVGITGVLCSKFCPQVVLTDHNEEVLKILKKNIELHASSEIPKCCAGLVAEKLEWGNSEQIGQILERYAGGFDLILGADIFCIQDSTAEERLVIDAVVPLFCFQQSSIPLLFNTVEQLLQVRGKQQCKFILAYVSRAKNMDSMILNVASRHGMRMTEVVGTRRVVGNLEGVIYEITLQ